MDTPSLLSAVAPVIGDLGAAFYFLPETGAVGKELGLNGMEFYVAGRGGSMGDCDGRAVAAAFGYFKPAVIAGAWDSAKSKVPPSKAASAHFECCANLGRAKLSGISELASFVAAAEKVVDAADPDGLALHAAFVTQTLAADTAGRAMQLIAVLREFRGSAHLVALRAVGLDSMVAHHAKRPEMTAMFGWTPEEAPVIDASVTARLAEAERVTDAIVAPAFDVLDASERARLVETLGSIKAALAP